MEWEEDYGGFHRGRGGGGRRKLRHGHKGCLNPLCKLGYFNATSQRFNRWMQDHSTPRRNNEPAHSRSSMHRSLS